MIIPFIALFVPPVVLREIKCISNVAHILSRVSNVTDRCQQRKEKTRNKIKLDLYFILGGMQQCNS